MSPGLATILRSVSVRFEVPSHQVVTGPLLFVIESKSTGRAKSLDVVSGKTAGSVRGKG
jgi:hypothetical protein